MLNQLFFV